MQLEHETKEALAAYITQEEVSKEITGWMVASIEPEFIEELKNEYTGYTNETPKSFLAHLANEYCAATIDDKLKAVREFETPWDQVVTISTWITRLEQLRRKCTEAGVDIDEARMVLTITANAMKCPLFTQLDHEHYDDLANHDIATVKAYWAKKYKAHKKINCDQSATNEYKSAAFTVEPPPSVVPPTGENGYDTYVSALKDVFAHQLVEHENELTVNTNATPTITMANIMAEMKKELTAMIAGMWQQTPAVAPAAEALEEVKTAADEGDASTNMERTRIERTYPNVPTAVNRPRTRQTTVSAYQRMRRRWKRQFLWMESS